MTKCFTQLSTTESTSIDGGCIFCDAAVVFGAIAFYSNPVTGIAATIGTIFYFGLK